MTCQNLSTPNLAPGWGCCKCHGYNGDGRELCRNCGHVRCALGALEMHEPPCGVIYAGKSHPYKHGAACVRGSGHVARNPDSPHASGEGINSGHVQWWTDAQKARVQ